MYLMKRKISINIHGSKRKYYYKKCGNLSDDDKVSNIKNDCKYGESFVISVNTA